MLHYICHLFLGPTGHWSGQFRILYQPITFRLSREGPQQGHLAHINACQDFRNCMQEILPLNFWEKPSTVNRLAWLTKECICIQACSPSTRLTLDITSKRLGLWQRTHPSDHHSKLQMKSHPQVSLSIQPNIPWHTSVLCSNSVVDVIARTSWDKNSDMTGLILVRSNRMS